MNLGETIKAFMQLEKINNIQLAEMAEVSTATIMAIKRSPEPQVSSATLYKISKALKQPLSRIFQIAETWETQ